MDPVESSPPRGRKPWDVKATIYSLVLLLIILVIGGIIAWAFDYPYINGRKDWQDERICTVDSAYKYSSGFRVGASQKNIIESSDCGRTFLYGVLEGKTIDETAQYLDAHPGAQYYEAYSKVGTHPTPTN